MDLSITIDWAKRVVRNRAISSGLAGEPIFSVMDDAGNVYVICNPVIGSQELLTGEIIARRNLEVVHYPPETKTTGDKFILTWKSQIQPIRRPDLIIKILSDGTIKDGANANR